MKNSEKVAKIDKSSHEALYSHINKVISNLINNSMYKNQTKINNNTII